MIPNSNPPQSNSQIVPFDFEGNQLRALRDESGNPWFIAADVCRLLGYSNTSQALKDNLDSDEISDIVTISPGYSQSGAAPKVISESGLYALILRSNMPKAKQFRKWITSEVLPSILRTGQYSVKKQDHILAMLDGIRETRIAQLELEQRVNQIEARQDAVDTELHHFTIIGYFRTRGKPAPDLNTAQTIGKKASALSRQLGYSIGKTTDPRFGQVSTYHEMILQQVLSW